MVITMRLKSILFFIATATCMALLPGTLAASEPPQRDGFAFSLGLGLADVRINQEWDGDPSPYTWGLAPLAMSIGWFVTPHWLLGVRTTGLSMTYQQLRSTSRPVQVVDPVTGTATVEWVDEEFNSPRRWFTSQLVGVAATYWLRDDLAASAALGMTFFGARPFSIFLDRGIGAALRLSVPVWSSPVQAALLSWELQPTIYRNYEWVLASMVLVEWQIY